MEVEDKLFTVKIRPDTEPHITVNTNICTLCEGKECTRFCPANVFAISNLRNKLIIAYENCLECGACPAGCPYGAIKYDNPRDGFGLI